MKAWCPASECAEPNKTIFERVYKDLAELLPTLLLRPGTTVEQANDASRDSDLRGPETGTAANHKSGQIGSVDPGQRMADE
jgi:hypothetical protein